MAKTKKSISDETISSKIVEVTLFTDQALVKRKATTRVGKGLKELLLEVEAFNVDSDSVSSKVYGAGEIYSVQLREIYLKEEPQQNIKELKERIKALTDKRNALQYNVNVLNKKDEFLNSLIDFSKSEIPKELKTSFPSINNLEKTLLFLDTNLEELNKKRQNIDLKIVDIDKDINLLNNELSSLMNASENTKMVIEILFNSKKEQDIQIEATYIVYDASWQPFYKVNAPLDLNEIDLIMFSRFIQKTGEDWNDIALSISNVIPMQGAGLPVLDTWSLDIERYEPSPAPPGKGAASRSRKKAKVPDEDAKEIAEPEAEYDEEERADYVQAERRELPLSFEYEIPQKLDVESQDKETILPLFLKKIQGDFSHYVVPRINPLTFLICEATPDSELLSGYLTVYFGGRYIGKTYLEEKKPGEKFNLNLGADREVKVKREKIKDKFKETFLKMVQRRTVIKEIAFKITVENLKAKPIKIHILDSIPVSRTDKVEVKDVNITPKPKEEKHQSKEGVLLWEFNLKPKEKQVIDIEFTVTYPKDEPVFGL